MCALKTAVLWQMWRATDSGSCSTTEAHPTGLCEGYPLFLPIITSLRGSGPAKSTGPQATPLLVPPPLLELLLVLSTLAFEASLGVVTKKCMGSISAPDTGAGGSPLASTRYALPEVSVSGTARGLCHAGHE